MSANGTGCCPIFALEIIRDSIVSAVEVQPWKHLMLSLLQGAVQSANGTNWCDLVNIPLLKSATGFSLGYSRYRTWATTSICVSYCRQEGRSGCQSERA